MSNLITTRLAVVSQMATLFHRVIGHVPSEVRASTYSIMTVFPQGLYIIVMSSGTEEYSIIIRTKAMNYSFDIKYKQYFKTVVLPIEPFKLDTMYVNYKGDFRKTFMGELFNKVGEIPVTFGQGYENDPEMIRFVSEVFFAKSYEYTLKGTIPTFNAKEMNYLISKAIRPKIAGELMFTNYVENGFTAADKKRKKKEEKVERRRRKEQKRLKEEERKRQEENAREKINVDDYPLYYPPPLSGF